MAKNKKRRPYNHTPAKPKGFILDNDSDTSATSEGASKKTVQENNYQKIPPPFKGDNNKNTFISWNEISIAWKTTIAVGTFFLIIVLPSVSFFSDLNNGLGNLQGDIKEIKKDTTNLATSSTKQSERLYQVEKQIAVINTKLPVQKTNSITNFVPKPINPPTKKLK